MIVYRHGYTAPMERLVSGWDHDATNISLRWSGGKSDGRLILRTYRSDGAGCFWLGLLCYEHIALMERGKS